MSIKAGRILTVADTFLIDRLQSSGPGNLNIPEERVYETGNYLTVGITRDRADLSFDLESLDMTTEVEALLTGVDPTTVVAGDEFDFNDALPVDIIAPFKGGGGVFTTTRGVAIPYLTLESASYRFGIRQNATQQFALRGDLIYYIPGTPYQAKYTVGATEAGPYALPNTALQMDESGDTFYVLSVCVKRADGSYERLFFGTDYTDTAADFTLTAAGVAKVAVGDVLHAVWGSATAATYAQAVHPVSTVKPAAVRHANIDVYVGPQAGTLERWSGVQSAEVNWRVQLDADEEFGNQKVVAQDYDVAEVGGTLTTRSATETELFDRIAQVTNRPSNEVAGVLSFTPLEIEVRISDPADGTILKTLFVPDAIIQPPAIQPRVQQKLETAFPFSSEGGQLLVYSGARP